MNSAASSRSREAAVVADGHSDYFATETHYLSLANRIVAALRPTGGFALVTGDPPPVPHLLSQALRKATLSRAAIVDIVCDADLTPEELSRLYSVVAAFPPSGEELAGSETAESARPIFVFAQADRLSDEQVREILRAAEQGGRTEAAALLLARPDFIARLEKQALQLQRERLIARFEFEDIGADEGIEFLRHQLAARHERSEARGMPAGILRGLAASGVLLILGIGVFLCFEPDHLVGGLSAPSDTHTATAPRSTPNETPMGAFGPMVPHMPPTAPSPQPVPLPQPEPPRNALAAMSAPATVSVPEPAPAPATSVDQHSPSTEVAALVSRGDGFLSAGDITSARLFYERAADAGNAAAALRLGATFDPGFLSRAGIRGIPGDAAQAAFWYRRARALGDAAAAERLKDLDEQRARLGTH